MVVVSDIFDGLPLIKVNARSSLVQNLLIIALIVEPSINPTSDASNDVTCEHQKCTLNFAGHIYIEII